MYINLVLIPFVIILGLLLSVNDSKRNRSVYIIICSVVFLLIGSLRSPEWMTMQYRIDTAVYKSLFESFSEVSWQECWDMAVHRYGSGGDDDIGFVVLNKLVSYVTNDYTIYSILTELLFFIPFGLILYRFSTSIRQLIFAFVFYVSLIQVFILGGARQMFSIGLDMLALLSVVDRKKWRAIIFFLLGVTIHFSSFLFLIPLLMVWFDVNPRILKWAHILCFVLFPIVLAFPNQIIVFMGEAAGVEKYANYGTGEIQGGATTFIILIELLSLFCFLAIKRTDLKINKNMRLFYVMTPLMTLLAPLIHSNGSMIRISLYYHLFLSLLVPYAIDCMFGKESRRIVYAITIGALAFLALQGGGTRYYFFWQV